MPVTNPSTRAPWFAAAVIVGIATWCIPCAIGGVREAWDWSVGAFVLLKLVDVTIGLRVSEGEEFDGLDITQHGEAGYHY